MRTLLLGMLATAFAFAGASAEEATDVLMNTLEKACAEKEQVAGPVRCRRHFSSKGYSVQWHGTDTSITHHGIGIEVLTQGDDAVVCWSSWVAVNDRSLCISLERRR
jgi:hypothetical protein